MRLNILDRGHRWTQKLVFKIVNWQMGHVPGPMKLLTYRRDFFGEAFTDCLQQGLRHGKHWTVGELELFAAFVSKLNQCEY
tara:strand:- start:563 stop:805 length:243 start_codon:yes stop_codon:yes gene_type:complete